MRNQRLAICVVLVISLLAGCTFDAARANGSAASASDTPETAAFNTKVEKTAPPENTAAPTVSPTVVPSVTRTAVPTATPTATALPTSTPTATPEPAPAGWRPPAAAPAVGESLQQVVDRVNTVLANTENGAALVLDPSDSAPLLTWLYAVVVPFPTLTDDISSADIRAFWSGNYAAMNTLVSAGTPATLFVCPETLASLKALLGEPADASYIRVESAETLIDLAWQARPKAWAIVPFDALEPRWKALHVDGLSLLDKGLNIADWPYKVGYRINGSNLDALRDAVNRAEIPLTNRDPEQMTVLMMTGVTALVRSIAYRMEIKGILYPAENIGEILASADITHISNEIPFYSGCPYPNPVQEDLVFCSDPKYIELLRAVGADLIELTGNHFQDYGDEATLETIAMYNEEGWPYYGGGKNLEDASKALVIESNGNSLSFIGCNPVGPEYAWATASRPGAAPCDWAFMWGELNKLAESVDVPIATFQYQEVYQYPAYDQQIKDFRSMADAGAKIVSGSQAHHPQAIEFYNGAFIHYGLGNLFFDQMQMLGTRQEVVDRHVIYKGRHLSTELLTFMLEDYSQPRPMTAEERAELLTSVFTASGW